MYKLNQVRSSSMEEMIQRSKNNSVTNKLFSTKATFVQSGTPPEFNDNQDYVNNNNSGFKRSITNTGLTNMKTSIMNEGLSKMKTFKEIKMKTLDEMKFKI